VTEDHCKSGNINTRYEVLRHLRQYKENPCNSMLYQSLWSHHSLTGSTNFSISMKTKAATLKWANAGPYTEPHHSYTHILINKKVIKVKWSRYWPGVAQRVGRVIALLFHDCSTRRVWVVSSTPQPHFTPGKDPVPILQGAGWTPGPVWMGRKSHPHRDTIPDRPARSSVTIPTELPGPHIQINTHCNILLSPP